MSDQFNQVRIKRIYQMLFEMASGNMTIRIQDNSNDELKSIAVALNKIAEDLQKINLASGYISAYYLYQNLIQLTFVLNNDFILLSFNNEVPLTLKYKPDTIVNTDFGKLIAQQSKDLWNGILVELDKNPHYNTTLQLILITGDNHLLQSFCTVSRLLYSDEIVVSSVSTILQEMLDINDRLSGSKIIARYRDKGTVDYTSHLKIDHIIELLKNENKYRNYTNKALGEESGFGSTQIFTRAFNNRTGLSPTYFISKLRSQQHS
ncbi:hypothetical protein [Flavobacterium sp. AED]|uniref:hypothetical protein n=1 Tax=Flavobacterium sp. AED TaxID=1423323 RepID=UPI00057F02D4|nr:hypothetical protein [Flavobacterium sp. AED]KIA86465.1 hypothetical protein OA85_02010 [Flavobacterium sp. AED]